MTCVIRARCDLCGDVELRPHDVRIYGRVYGFDCPACGFRVEKPAPAEVLALLATAGVYPAPPLEEDDVVRMLGEVLGVEG